jgi:hypothetical protein
MDEFDNIVRPLVEEQGGLKPEVEAVYEAARVANEHLDRVKANLGDRDLSFVVLWQMSGLTPVRCNTHIGLVQAQTRKLNACIELAEAFLDGEEVES